MLIASLLFGISASLDALLVGIGFGLRRVRIRLWQNLVISLVTLLGTCLSVGLGHRLAALLPGAVSAYAGSLVLILMGLYYIAKWCAGLLRSCHRMRHGLSAEGGTKLEPAGSSMDCPAALPGALPKPGPLGTLQETDCGEKAGRGCRAASIGGTAASLRLAEVLTLSLTLSLNNLSAGLSASLAGLALVPAAIATFACSVLFLAGGNRLGGSHALQLAGCAAEPVSGALLIGLGAVWLFW